MRLLLLSLLSCLTCFAVADADLSRNLIETRITTLAVSHDNGSSKVAGGGLLPAGRGVVDIASTLTTLTTSTSKLNHASIENRHNSPLNNPPQNTLYPRKPSTTTTILTTLSTATSAAQAPTTNRPDIFAQLPPYWPYVKHGISRRPGLTATFTLTEPGEDGVPATVLLAPLQWYPRPLSSHDVLADYVYSTIAPTASTSSVIRPSTTSSMRPGQGSELTGVPTGKGSVTPSVTQTPV